MGHRRRRAHPHGRLNSLSGPYVCPHPPGPRTPRRVTSPPAPSYSRRLAVRPASRFKGLRGAPRKAVPGRRELPLSVSGASLLSATPGSCPQGPAFLLHDDRRPAGGVTTREGGEKHRDGQTDGAHRSKRRRRVCRRSPPFPLTSTRTPRRTARKWEGTVKRSLLPGRFSPRGVTVGPVTSAHGGVTARKEPVNVAPRLRQGPQMTGRRHPPALAPGLTRNRR